MKHRCVKRRIGYAFAMSLVLILALACVVACSTSNVEHNDQTEMTDGATSPVTSVYFSLSSADTSAESLPTSDPHTLQSSFTSPESSDVETTKSTKVTKDDRTTAKSTGKTSPTTASQQSPTTTTTTSATSSEFFDVTVLVECRNAVKHRAFADKIEWMISKGYCNENGVMFHGTVRLKRGETVFDALIKTKLQVLHRTTLFSKYVYEVNRLREKDCYQPRSGWVYLVNGAFGQVSSDARVLNDNDVVHWGYTIVEGDVK